jgi:hypothetical protein
VNLTAITNGVYRFGFDASDPVVDWINEAQTEFVDSYTWPFLQTSFTNVFTVGSNFITPLPSDFGIPISLSYFTLDNKTKFPLDYRSTTDVESNETYPLAKGRPEWWSTYAGAPFIYPLADAVYPYELDYKKEVPILVAGADVPIIPSKYHYALVRGAASIGLDTDNQEERSSVQYQRFRDIIDRAIARYQQPQAGSFDRVRVVY